MGVSQQRSTEQRAAARRLAALRSLLRPSCCPSPSPPSPATAAASAGASDRLTVWGRTSSVNVQKVLWALDELGVPYERVDAGLQFGVNDTDEYLAMNPNGDRPARC